MVADYIGGEAFSQPLIEWLVEYFKTARRTADTTDIIRILALSLPNMLKTVPASDDWWYKVGSVKTHLIELLDDDSTERITTSSVVKWLKPLGFNEFRTTKGKEVRILEEDLRKVFQERRIDALIDDLAWAESLVDYQTEESKTIPAETVKLQWGEDDD